MLISPRPQPVQPVLHRVPQRQVPVQVPVQVHRLQLAHQPVQPPHYSGIIYL